MDIKIDPKDGKITAKATGKSAKGKETVEIEITNALELSKRLKEAAYLSNRLKKINTWNKDRREAALAKLGL